MMLIITYMKGVNMAISVGAMMAYSFASSFLQTKLEENNYDDMIKKYDNEAQINRLNAKNIRLNGALNEDILRSQNRAYVANFRALAGENGMGESPTMVSRLSNLASSLEQNVLNERYKIESQAENYLYQANVFDANKRLMKKEKNNAFTRSLLDAGLASLNYKFGGGLW